MDMPSTMWTAIHQAREKGHPALDEILRKYRPPVLSFLRSKGFHPAEADDLAQEVFLSIIRDDVLSRADRERGRFRSLLFAIIRNIIADKWRAEGRLKRGGGRKTVPMESREGDAELDLSDLLATREKDDTFDFLWIHNLIRIGMSRLEEECERESTLYFQALFLLTNEEKSYQDISETLGQSPANTKNLIHQGRIKLRRYVLEEVEIYSSTRDEYDSEVEYLMKYLR